ncbi:hypothetical protein GTY65_07310 [Streptomyces sp. SID8379]|uniref:hypothetical protein n=1 Tax=unclassified Streptomyces TaxID=2593676 RepID=UPI0003761DEF|nr:MULTISPECIES: hypothetical protein [unclassified Streptomyces]MYW63879.1 hypothetical protein [Streptomyces sp. SID8379]
MDERLPHPARRLLPALAPAATALAAWALWLGWDQTRDVHPDGSVTGPYEAWQVIGLVLTLLAPLYWSASRHHATAAALGTTTGLTAAAAYDWSDDSSGLFMVGVVLVMLGSLAATGALSTAISTAKRGTA